jgi:DNA-binding NarL/FixJ family response regulator
MNQIKVLLVDDHERFRSTLAFFLKSRSGVGEVIEATDGNDAVEKTLVLKPDLVLIEVHLTNRSGIEATRAIKNLSPNTVVIMMSMDSSESYSQSARLLADGYVAKSSVKKPLLAILASYRDRLPSQVPVTVTV